MNDLLFREKISILVFPEIFRKICIFRNFPEIFRKFPGNIFSISPQLCASVLRGRGGTMASSAGAEFRLPGSIASWRKIRKTIFRKFSGKPDFPEILRKNPEMDFQKNSRLGQYPLLGTRFMPGHVGLSRCDWLGVPELPTVLREPYADSKLLAL